MCTHVLGQVCHPRRMQATSMSTSHTHEKQRMCLAQECMVISWQGDKCCELACTNCVCSLCGRSSLERRTRYISLSGRQQLARRRMPIRILQIVRCSSWSVEKLLEAWAQAISCHMRRTVSTAGWVSRFRMFATWAHKGRQPKSPFWCFWILMRSCLICFLVGLSR